MSLREFARQRDNAARGRARRRRALPLHARLQRFLLRGRHRAVRRRHGVLRAARSGPEAWSRRSSMWGLAELLVAPHAAGAAGHPAGDFLHRLRLSRPCRSICLLDDIVQPGCQRSRVLAAGSIAQFWTGEASLAVAIQRARRRVPRRASTTRASGCRSRCCRSRQPRVVAVVAGVRRRCCRPSAQIAASLMFARSAAPSSSPSRCASTCPTANA